MKRQQMCCSEDKNMKDKIVKLLIYVSLTTSVFVFSTFSVNAAENDVDTATEGDATVIEYNNSIENNPDIANMPGGNNDDITGDNNNDLPSGDTSNVPGGNNDDLPGGNNDDVPEDDTDKAVYATVFDGVDYSPVYDYEYYINRYHDLKAAYGNNDVAALRHFVIFGMKEGRTGNESFDVYSYKNAYSDLRSVFGTDLSRYYNHYLSYGINENRKNIYGVNEIDRPISSYKGTDYSPVYNYDYYLSNHKDVKNAFNSDDILSLLHFINYGMQEGRRASESFNVVSYIYEYQDLRKAFGRNLPRYYMHYINNGRAEGRKTDGTTELKNPVTVQDGVDYSPVYDYKYYTARYSDIKQAFGFDDTAVLKHFTTYGMNELRVGCENFEAKSYAYKYVDLRRAFKDNFKAYYMHFVKFGKDENRVTTGVTRMENYETHFFNLNYDFMYDFNDYWNKSEEVRKITTFDDLKAIDYFVRHDAQKIIMTAAELVQKLKSLAARDTYYKSVFPDDLCYVHEDGRVSADCSNLYKSLLNGYDINNKTPGYYQKDLYNTGDCTTRDLFTQCTDISNDFTKLKYGEPRMLWKEGHVGGYLGEDVEINGRIYNVIECTPAFGGGIVYSYVDIYGRRLSCKGGYSAGSWTNHGLMSRWLTY